MDAKYLAVHRSALSPSLAEIHISSETVQLAPWKAEAPWVLIGK